MADTTENVNRGIRILLVRKGMKQTDLMKSAGLKQNYFTTRINGHRDWTLKELDRISIALGLTGAPDIISLADKEQQLTA